MAEKGKIPSVVKIIKKTILMVELPPKLSREKNHLVIIEL